MNIAPVLTDQTLHIWKVFLNDFVFLETELRRLLHTDELARAQRFKFEIHRRRFIITRGILRRVLNLYTGIPPEQITFHYGDRGKPFLNDTDIQFNISHSDDLAVFAITKNIEVGIDIEKVEPDFKETVAKRFFSTAEYEALMQLPDAERVVGFYRIWSKKEALIKALGEGLYAPLDAFTVSIHGDIETVAVAHERQIINYQLQNFFVHEDYQAAVAVRDAVEEIKYLIWGTHAGGDKNSRFPAA